MNIEDEYSELKKKYSEAKMEYYELKSKYNMILEENTKLKNEIRNIKKNSYEWVCEEKEIKSGEELYKVSGLLAKYGFFTEGELKYCDFDNLTGITTIRPHHKKILTLMQTLSRALALKYEELNNGEKNCIGRGFSMNTKKKSTRRTNSFPNLPPYEKIVREFMDMNPREFWLNDSKIDERIYFSKDNKKKHEDKMNEKINRNKKRVEKFLQKKEYLPQRIRNKKKSDKEAAGKLIKEYNDIVIHCREQMPKNKEMDIIFKNLISKI